MATQGTDGELDIVLLGATGFTGGLTAAYLAEHAPPGLRWALAGRSATKLEAVRDKLELPSLPLITADSADAESLAALVRRTKVVITTIAFPSPIAASCSGPIATGESLSRLARSVESDCLAGA